MIFLAQKITPFLVVCGLAIALGVPVGLYKLTRTGTEGIVGVYLLFMAVIAVLLLLLDRFLVRHVNLGGLSAGELIVFFVGCGLVAYNGRETTLDISANPAPYFVLIWTKDKSTAPPLAYRFPFDKLAVVSGASVALLPDSEFSRTNVKAPDRWGGTFSRGLALTHTRFASAYFYGPDVYMDRSAEVDSLVRQAVAGAGD